MLKACRVINIIKHSLSVRDTAALKQLYQQYYQSVLLYCSEVWFNLEPATLKKIMHADERFWRLRPYGVQRPNVWNSVQICVKKSLMLYFKYKHRIHVVDLETNFEYVQNATETRSSMRGDLKLPKMRMAMKRNKFVSVTTKIFNLMDSVQRESRLILNYERAVESMIAQEFTEEKLQILTS